VVACPPGDVDAVKRLDLGPAGMAPPASDYPPALSLTWDPRFNGHFASPPFTRYRLDWAAEVSCLVPMGDRLLAGNRAELVSLDPKSGGEQWRLAAGPQPGAVTAIGLMPMRPVCDTRQAYVRRIAHGNAATLAAVSLTDGKLVWETKPDPARVLISDPVLVDGYIRICEVDPAMIDALVLVTIDPATGRRAAVRPMGEVLGSWRVGRSNRADFGDCQITTAGGRLFISAGGAVLCCTAHGEPIWLRQQPWLPVATNGWWWYQAQSPPVVHGEKVYVVQPGVEAVTALDAAMGTIRWRKHVPLVRRMVGIAGKGDAARLVVETGEGVVAVDLRDGDVTTLVDGRDGPGSDWTSLVAPSRLLGAAVATADGQAIVAVQRRRPDTAATATLDAALLWIDVVTGAVRHEAVVPPLTGKPPWVGPLAAAEGKLWLLSQANPADLRRSLWEVTAKPAAPPAQ
jgi:outer membrane protein assembly factor BamB